MGNIYYYFFTKNNFRDVAEEYVKGVESKNVAPHNNNDVDTQKDSLRLKIEYSEKEVEELKDTIKELKRKTVPSHKEMGEKQKLINQIISDVNTIKSINGKNKDEIVKNKKLHRQQILQKIKKLKENNKRESENLQRIELKLRSKDIIDTDKKGNLSSLANNAIKNIKASIEELNE